MAERASVGLWADVDRYFDAVVTVKCPHCGQELRATRREFRDDQEHGPRKRHLDTLRCRAARAESSRE